MANKPLRIISKTLLSKDKLLTQVPGYLDCFARQHVFIQQLLTSRGAFRIAGSELDHSKRVDRKTHHVSQRIL